MLDSKTLLYYKQNLTKVSFKGGRVNLMKMYSNLSGDWITRALLKYYFDGSKHWDLLHNLCQ